jgi:hypothetical protein
MKMDRLNFAGLSNNCGLRIIAPLMGEAEDLEVIGVRD